MPSRFRLRSADEIRPLAALWRWLRRREGLLAAAGYAVALSLVYGNVVFLDDSLVHSNNLNMIDFRMTAELYGPGFDPPTVWSDRNLSRTANLSDPGATWSQWETSGIFLRRSLARGELPFWDPWAGAGAPAMTNLTPAFFFPPYLLLVGLGNTVLLKNFYYLALLLAASWCTWSLLRRSGLSWLASFFGGLVFMLSGGLTQTLGSIVGQTACCIPVALLATRWFLERSSWAAAAGLGVVYGSIALASFPPVLFAAFGSSAIYALVELARETGCVERGRRRTAIRYAAAIAMGIGLVAFYYLPAFRMASLLPQAEEFYRNASSHTRVSPPSLLQLLAPAVMGGVPVWADEPIPRESPGAFHYVGVVALLMIALVGWKHLRKPLWSVAFWGAVLVVGLMLGIGPFEAVRNLPVLRNIHFGNYYGIVLDFFFALLAAAGFERLRRSEISLMRAWAGVTAVLVAVLAVLLRAFTLRVASHPGFEEWLSRYLALPAIAFVGATVVFAALSAASARRRVAVCSSMLVAMLVAEGTWNARFPRQQRWEVWAHPPAYVRFLQGEADLQRVFSMSAIFYANAGTAFRVAQLDSLWTLNPPRIFELYRRYANPRAYLLLRDATDLPPEPVLDAAAISHLVLLTHSPPLAELKARGHAKVFDDGFVKVFKRQGPPRYFFTRDFTVAAAGDTLEAVGRPRRERQIVLERSPLFGPRRNRPQDLVPVRIEHASANSVRLSLVAPRRGFLYAADSFFPGWRATVNGRPQPIEPANHAFRAVEVPRGPAIIEMRFVPIGFREGLSLSVVALLTVIAVFARSTLHIFKQRETSETAARDPSQEKT